VPLHVLIVPDKFKGTLTAQAAAKLIGRGWSKVRPTDSVALLPMSDGGDGFGEVVASLLNVDACMVETNDAAHRPCRAPWWLDASTGLAVIESARVIGLALLPPSQYHPFELDTAGLGPVLEAACQAGCSRVLIGIGGSATNDGGFGLARSLGWSFLDTTSRALTGWTELSMLAHIRTPQPSRPISEILVAVDVQNPLLGPRGASRVYGPQKGLRPQDFVLAEACLARLAEVAKHDLGVDAAAEPGTGAAGGLGFGLRCFLNARLESGFNLFARYAQLEERIGSADLVITGEGAIDASTMMGKGVGEIARLCRERNVPCVGLAGTLVLEPKVAGSLFTKLYGITPHLTSLENAKAAAETWLPQLAAVAARENG
jgi:glycerate kinase